MTGRASFADRLNVARKLIARRSVPPVHLTDQLHAAGSEARAMHDHLGILLPIVAPDRPWRSRVDTSPSTATRAYLLAAVLDCTTMCVHLRRGGPRPAFVQLPLRRIDCARCIRTLRRPPPDEADRCDVCTSRGVTTFHPFAVHQGPVMLVGDACPSCADVLGIRQEVSA